MYCIWLLDAFIKHYQTMNFFDNIQMQIIFQLILATFLGCVVGLERQYKRKEAGVRTYGLVCLGSALFTIVSFQNSLLYLDKTGITVDPSRIVGQIVVGIGFIGAGLIIYRQTHVEGLTTAAGLWVVAGIGIAVAYSFYLVAVFAAFLTIGVLAGLRIFEEKLEEKKGIRP